MPKIKKPKSDGAGGASKKPQQQQVSSKPSAANEASSAATSVKSPPPQPKPEQEKVQVPAATTAPTTTPKNGGSDKPEEMDAERELADDAAWKRIQQNTFTRWANEHLKTANKNIGNLETDLADGIRLAVLIEVLSGKKLGKYNKKPSFRSQKLENCSVALKFLMQDEGIKIVNIDSTDIVDCKLKLILGLIWTLILHYSISMPMWEGEDESQYKGKANATPKQRLLGWIQSKIPELPISNFTSDWNNGKAIGALVDAVAPGLCPDWEDWDPKNALKNAQEAMELASKWLDIPELIKPSELTNPVIDEMSVMTYLSQFPKAKLKDGAPLRPRTNPKKVRAYGPGIEPTGVHCGAPTNLTVETFSAGKGEVAVEVTNPKNQKEPVDMTFNNDKGKTYTVKYTPRMEGAHKVKINFAGKDIPKSPFQVEVKGFAGDPNKVVTTGPGIEPVGVTAGGPTYFDVHTKEAGLGLVEVIVLDPQGSKTSVPCKVTKTEEGHYHCEYSPVDAGMHSVNVFFAGKPIPKSPYGVKVGPVSDAKKVRATGRGLQANGIRIGDAADIRVFTENAGDGKLEVKVVGPDGIPIPVEMKNGENKIYDCIYRPTQKGRHVVLITYDAKETPKSPYEINVGPFKESKIYAFGPGLKGGMVDKPAHFTVETNGETGALGFSIEGPSEAKIDCVDNGDGSADVTYFPTLPGEYAVHVLCDNEDIPKSPFMANITPTALNISPDKVEVSGPGVQENGVAIGKPTEFTINTKKAGGPAPVEVIVEDSNHKRLPVQVKDNHDGTYKCSYKPESPLRHTVQVNYAGLATPKSPYRVNISSPIDASKVKIFGPGLEDGVKPQTPTHFNIDCTEAGQGDVQVALTNEKGEDIEFSIQDNLDSTFTIEYSVPAPGKYKVTTLFGGKEIPKSPVNVTVKSDIDVSKVKVDGLQPAKIGAEEPAIAAQQAPVPVAAAPTPKGNGKKKNGAKGSQPQDPSKKGQQQPAQKAQVEPANKGQPEPAKTAADGTQQGKAPEKPKQPVDVGKIKVTGGGIQPEGVFKDSPTDFTVDARPVTSKGDGKVTCSVTNPSGKKTDAMVKSLNDGTYKVCYTPFEEGTHTIQIAYDGAPIPGSPFKVNVTKGCDPSKCRAYGPGLEKGITGVPNTFTIETKGAGIGGLGLSVEGPSEAQMNCVDNQDGTCTVEYIPNDPGVYDIGIKFADQDIPGSAFKVPVEVAVDPTKVTAYGPGIEPNHCRANVPQKFTINTIKAGKAPVDVQVSSEKGPVAEKPVVKDNGDGTYDVAYKPPPVGSKCDVKVTHGGKEIPKSPFQMKVLPTIEPQNVKVSGSGVEDKPIPASMPADVIIDTKTAGFGDLEVGVVGPDGEPRKAKVVDNGDGTHKATYVPDDVGSYKVDVKYGGQNVPKSPFNVKSVPTGQADKCKITEGLQEELTIGEEHCITVNTQQAGNGKVTCRIRSSSVSGPAGQTPAGQAPAAPGSALVPQVKPRNGTKPGDMNVNVEENKDGTYSIYYTVMEPGDYSMDVKYGGQNVPNGVYRVKATEEIIEQKEVTVVETTKKYSTTTQTQRTITQEEHFTKVSFDKICVPSSTSGQLTAEVKMPSGKIDQPKIIDNKDGTVSVEFDPKEEGHHEMIVKYNHEHVDGSPFTFHVDKIKSGHITAHGPGLTHGVCGEPCNFTITTKDAGAAGGLQLAIEGPSKADITCKDNKDGTVSVSYLPTAPGEYNVSVKFANKHIMGSPYLPKVTGEGRKRNQISVGHSSEVSLKVTEKDVKSLNASIVAPSGLEEPCFVKKLPNGHLGISFTPREKGEHSVNVKRMGDHIPKSPFKIQVGEREIGDACKVKVTGNAIKTGKTGVANEFSINTKDAGYGGLSLSIEGPSKADIQCKDNENGTLNVSYKPTEPGYYIINLKFADHHVPGSPFTVKVTGEGSGSQTERIKRDREAVPITDVGNECKFTFRLPGTNPFDMIARVTSPDGQTEDAEIVDLNDSTYAVHFVPKELGVHTISIRHKDIHIPGSPFQFTVGALKEGGSHKVHAGGPGLERGEVSRPCEFNVWTREAGAGHLAISVEGPSKAEIDFQDRKDGSCYVTYTVAEQGEYRVGIKFNDQHIPDSPYKVYLTPGTADANKVEVGDLPDNNLHVNKPVGFIMHMNGAKGIPDGRVIGPDGKEDDAFISPVDEDQYALRFMPKMNGVHNIHVTLGGAHIPESPIRLRIGKDEADPAVVHAFGNGIISIRTGQKTDFIVDTCNAGSGALAVTIDGPSKVSMDCTEVEDGYKVRYTPLAPGEYFVTVKYSGYHIVGSPFRVKCSGKAVAESSVGETSSVVVETNVKESKFKSAGIVLPKFRSDASKVTCKGLGLKKGYLHKQNQFNINCIDAGNNMIYVSVYGPKAPVEEVFVKHNGNHSFTVNYLAKERGEHFVVVKYGEDNIPGSPFRVDIM